MDVERGSKRSKITPRGRTAGASRVRRRGALPVRVTKSRAALERVLSGGDLRSTGASDDAAGALLAGTWTAGDFLRLIEKSAPVVRMRAADALEKATRSSPQLLAGAARRMLALLDSTQPKEVRWHLLQMAPRVRWPARRIPALLVAVEAAFTDTSAIVRASALQALAELSLQSRQFRGPFEARLKQASGSRSPSLRARARRLVARHARGAPA